MGRASLPDMTGKMPVPPVAELCSGGNALMLSQITDDNFGEKVKPENNVEITKFSNDFLGALGDLGYNVITSDPALYTAVAAGIIGGFKVAQRIINS